MTFASLPIDVLVRDHLLGDDGSVLVRNVASSGRSSCRTLLYEGGGDPTTDGAVRSAPDRWVAFGAGGPFSHGDAATATNGAGPPAIREDTGEPDPSPSPGSPRHGAVAAEWCAARFEFRCANPGGRRPRRLRTRRLRTRRLRTRAPPAAPSPPSSSEPSAPPRGDGALAVLLNGVGVPLVHIGGGGGDDGDQIGGVLVPAPVDGVGSGADSRHYVEYALDGGAVSAEGFTVDLGLYYSVSEGVKGNEEGGAKTTMTITTTETASLLPPPGWNTIEFVIEDAGDDNVDSWVFLRAGSFSCVAVGGGVDGEATKMTTGGGSGGAGDNAAVSLNVSKMDTSVTRSGIPRLYAVVILIFLGLIALSLPVIGLTFYNKRIPSG